MKLDKVCASPYQLTPLLAVLSINPGQFRNNRTRGVPLTSSSLIESSSHPVFDLQPDDPDNLETSLANQFPL